MGIQSLFDSPLIFLDKILLILLIRKTHLIAFLVLESKVVSLVYMMASVSFRIFLFIVNSLFLFISIMSILLSFFILMVLVSRRSIFCWKVHLMILLILLLRRILSFIWIWSFTFLAFIILHHIKFRQLKNNLKEVDKMARILFCDCLAFNMSEIHQEHVRRKSINKLLELLAGRLRTIFNQRYFILHEWKHLLEHLDVDLFVVEIIKKMYVNV